MPSGHASHQTGLDADILFRLSDHPLTTEERDDPDFTGVLDHGHVVTARWGEAQWAALKSFASDQRIERVFVNPAIKKYLCLNTQGDRSWLHHVRPWWGHEAHFHIRLNCPEGNSACEPGPKIPEGDGCGADLDWWFTKEAQPAAPLAKPAPPKPPPPIPAACRAILAGK
jgi:penicillin-insensitive murein endopeptidase